MHDYQMLSIPVCVVRVPYMHTQEDNSFPSNLFGSKVVVCWQGQGVLASLLQILLIEKKIILKILIQHKKKRMMPQINKIKNIVRVRVRGLATMQNTTRRIIRRRKIMILFVLLTNMVFFVCQHFQPNHYTTLHTTDTDTDTDTDAEHTITSTHTPNAAFNIKKGLILLLISTTIAAAAAVVIVVAAAAAATSSSSSSLPSLALPLPSPSHLPSSSSIDTTTSHKNYVTVSPPSSSSTKYATAIAPLLLLLLLLSSSSSSSSSPSSSQLPTAVSSSSAAKMASPAAADTVVLSSLSNDTRH